jgi:hypothetical protein
VFLPARFLERLRFGPSVSFHDDRYTFLQRFAVVFGIVGRREGEQLRPVYLPRRDLGRLVGHGLGRALAERREQLGLVRPD